MRNQLLKNHQTSGTGSTDWTIPAGATHVDVRYQPTEEATSEHRVAFRSAAAEVSLIGVVESIGNYRFFNKIPATATLVRVTNGGAGPSVLYQQDVNFIVRVI